MFKGQIEIVDPDDDLSSTYDPAMQRAIEERLDRVSRLIAPPRKDKRKQKR